jgi:hypothetical protein
MGRGSVASLDCALFFVFEVLQVILNGVRHSVRANASMGPPHQRGGDSLDANLFRPSAVRLGARREFAPCGLAVETGVFDPASHGVYPVVPNFARYTDVNYDLQG